MIRFLLILLLGYQTIQAQEKNESPVFKVIIEKAGNSNNKSEIPGQQMTLEQLETFMSEKGWEITNTRKSLDPDSNVLIVEYTEPKTIPRDIPVTISEDVLSYLEFDDIEKNPKNKKSIGLVYEPHWNKKEQLYFYYGFKKLLKENDDKNFIFFDEGIVVSKEKKEVSVKGLKGALEVDLLNALQKNYVDVPAILKFRNSKKVKLYGTEDEAELKKSSKIQGELVQLEEKGTNNFPKEPYPKTISLAERNELRKKKITSNKEIIENSKEDKFAKIVKILEVNNQQLQVNVDFYETNKAKQTEKEKISKELQSENLTESQRNELIKKIITLNKEIIENSKEDKFAEIVQSFKDGNEKLQVNVNFYETSKSKLADREKISKELQSENLTESQRNELIKKMITLNKEIIENSKEDKFVKIIQSFKDDNEKLQVNVEFFEKNEAKLTEKEKISKEFQSENLTVSQNVKLTKKKIALNKEIIKNSKEDKFAKIVKKLEENNQNLRLDIESSNQTLVRDKFILNTINEISKDDKDSILFVFIGSGHYPNLKAELRKTFNTYRVKVTIKEKDKQKDYIEYNKAISDPAYIQNENKITDRWNIPEVNRQIGRNGSPDNNSFYRKIEKEFGKGDTVSIPTIETMNGENDPILSFSLDENSNVSNFSIKNNFNAEEMTELTNIATINKKKLLESEYLSVGDFRFYVSENNGNKIITAYRKQGGLSREEKMKILKGNIRQGDQNGNQNNRRLRQKDNSVENEKIFLKVA